MCEHRETLDHREISVFTTIIPLLLGCGECAHVLVEDGLYDVWQHGGKHAGALDGEHLEHQLYHRQHQDHALRPQVRQQRRQRLHQRRRVPLEIIQIHGDDNS